MMRDELEALRGQQVEVVYNGMVYKGMLMGTSEETIDLQTREQWVALPMEGVTSVRRAGEKSFKGGMDSGPEEPPHGP
jgi:hypothetical protein